MARGFGLEVMMDSKQVPERFVSFVVTIEQHGGAEGIYQSRLTRSPVGGRPTMTIDLNSLDLGDLGGAHHHFEPRESDSSLGLPSRHLRNGGFEGMDLRQSGEVLFRSIFVGRLAQAFRASVERTRSAGFGLRICLLLDSVPELTDLPWEALWDPVSHAFLADQPNLLVVRTLSVAAEMQATRPSTPPLRLLALLPQPRGEVPLSGLAEWGEIGQHLSPLIDAGTLRHDRVEPPALRALGEAFDGGPCHVLHVVAHGRPGGMGEGGVLSLEDEYGRVDEVTGGELARALERHFALRLVVLNVCFGGYGPADDPFDGLAQTLLRRGIPAVVAMRGEISDAAAVTFGSALYRELANGRTVEAAMIGARRSLALGKHRSEWATPVLYLQGENVHLFPKAAIHADSEEARDGQSPETVGRAQQSARLHPSSNGSWSNGVKAVVAAVALAGLIFSHWIIGGGKEIEPHTGLTNEEPEPLLAPELTYCPSPPGLEDLQFVRIEPGVLPLASKTLVVEKAFCISTTEVTRRQWLEVMGGKLPRPELADDLPIFHVTIDEARRFTQLLGQRDPGSTYRLPTATEWEYAGRAGETSDYFFGDHAAELHRYGKCENASADDGYDQWAPVKSFAPNPWGLFDIHGNVSEWVEAVNPEKPGEVLHLGGSYEHTPGNCAFDTKRWVQGKAMYYTGFRVVFEQP